MDVVKKIRYFREIRGLSQMKLSQLAGIGFSTIRKYESGERYPKDYQLEKVASALGVSKNVLVDIEAITVGDFMHYFISLAKTGDIKFHGSKQDDGKYDPDSLTFSFNTKTLKDAIKQYADGKELIEKLKADAESCSDDVKKANLQHDAEVLENLLEVKLVDSGRVINSPSGITMKINTKK